MTSSSAVGCRHYSKKGPASSALNDERNQLTIVPRIERLFSDSAQLRLTQRPAKAKEVKLCFISRTMNRLVSDGL